MRIKKIQHRRGFGGGRVGVRYSTLLSLFDDYGIGGNHQICRCSIMASTSVFQTDDTGSIPVTGFERRQSFNGNPTYNDCNKELHGAATAS